MTQMMADDEENGRSDTVKSGRLFFTDTERRIVTGEEDVDSGYRRPVLSRIRDRYRRNLGDKGDAANDLDVLAENLPDEYDEVVGLVRQHATENGATWRNALGFLADPDAFDVLVTQIAAQQDVDEEQVETTLGLFRDHVEQQHPSDDAE